MKNTPTLALLACAALAATTALAQGAQETPPTPPPDAQPPAGGATPPAPAPPAAPQPPPPPAANPPAIRHHAMPPARGPFTFLGVGVEPLPPAATQEAGLPAGFGLLVNFVVPGGAAEAAGVKPHDILKTLNDQILIDPGQLAALVRSFPENQEVTLGVMRDGQETKLTAKLQKHTPEETDMPPREKHPRVFTKNFDDDEDEPEGKVAPPPPLPPVREILRELAPLIKEQEEKAKRVIREQQEATREAADQARRASEKADEIQREITILREQNGASRSTRLDLGHARIVIRDESGELELKAAAGKRFLTAKDPQGKVIFSGPVDTSEQRDAMPPEVRGRLEKLEKEESLQFDPAAKDHYAQPPAKSGTE